MHFYISFYSIIMKSRFMYRFDVRLDCKSTWMDRTNAGQYYIIFNQL